MPSSLRMSLRCAVFTLLAAACARAQQCFNASAAACAPDGSGAAGVNAGPYYCTNATTCACVWGGWQCPAPAGLASGSGTASFFSAPAGVVGLPGNTYFDAIPGLGSFLVASDNAIRAVAGDLSAPATTVQTVAGGASAGFVNSANKPTRAHFSSPAGMAFVGSGTSASLWVADVGNHALREISVVVTAPLSLSSFTLSAILALVNSFAIRVSTIAGNGAAGFADGDGSAARFKQPSGLAYAAGSVYVTDTGNHAIRVVASTSPYSVATIAGNGSAGRADGVGSSARLSSPTGIAYAGLNSGFTSALYVADAGTARIRCVTLASPASVTTWLGGPPRPRAARAGRARQRSSAGRRAWPCPRA